MNKKLTFIIGLQALLIITLFWGLVFFAKDEYDAHQTEQAEEIETRVAITEGNQLVRVELFNLLIGEEKNAIYEKARLLGATSLPQKREWQRWSVGTGLSQSDKKVITFLIPPEFGKLPSGSIAMVELASPGELNVARYKGN